MALEGGQPLMGRLWKEVKWNRTNSFPAEIKQNCRPNNAIECSSAEVLDLYDKRLPEIDHIVLGDWHVPRAGGRALPKF